MFKVNNKDVTDIILFFILLTQNILETLFSVSIVNFEHANTRNC